MIRALGRAIAIDTPPSRARNRALGHDSPRLQRREILGLSTIDTRCVELHLDPSGTVDIQPSPYDPW